MKYILFQHKATKYLKMIFKNVLECIDVGCYSESKYCFELFGADVMLDEDFNMKLIEINTKVGYNFNFFEGRPNSIEIDKIMMDNLLEVFIDDIIPPKHKVKNNNKFIKV